MKSFLFVFLLIIFSRFTIFSQNGSLRLSLDVEPEMLDAEFWISMSDEAEKIRLGHEEIVGLNKKSMEIKRDGKKTILFNLAEFNSISESDLFLLTLSECFGRKWYRKSILDEPVCCTSEYWNSLFEKTGINALKDSEVLIEPKKAVCNKRTDMRIVPSDEEFSANGYDWYNDINQESSLLFNDPVLMLFCSKNEEWCFICSEYDYGWVKSDSIALSSDNDFEKRLYFLTEESGSFVTVTESLYIIPSGDLTASVDGKKVYTELRMGERFFCTEWETVQVYFSEDRFPFCSYAVEIPFRKEDGTLGTAYAAVPVSAVCSGFLPFTVKNILTLAFKCLGQAYSWGGKNGLRDCSSMVMEIYRCMGFQLPRNSSEQALFPAKSIKIDGASGYEQRTVLLNGIMPGAVLKIPGHVMLYLGSSDERHYVIHSTSGYYESEEDIAAGKLMNVNSVCVTSLDMLMGNGKTLLESVSSVLFY